MKSAHMATKRRKERGVDKYLTMVIMKPLVTIYYNDTRDLVIIIKTVLKNYDKRLQMIY